MIVSVFAVTIGETDSNAVYGAPTSTITYHDSADTSNSDVSVPQYGIASTEYNPEKWQGTGGITQSTPNWVGPLIDLSKKDDYASMRTGDATITFAKAYSGTTYTVTLPANFSDIKVKKVANINQLNGVGEPDQEGFYPVTGNSFKFTVTGSNVNAQLEIKANYDLRVNMVFGGWLKSAGTVNEQLILPGDVVDDDDGDLSTPLVLTAKWVVPDIFKLKIDQVDCNAGSSFEISLVSPYAYLGNIYSKKNVQLIGEYTIGSDHYSNTGKYDDGSESLNVVRGTDLVTFNEGYSTDKTKVTLGDKRTGADMFGTKYLLLKDRSKDGAGIFYLDVEGAGNEYLKRFPAGTYTSTTDGNRVSVVINSNATSGMAGLIGNAVFDTMTLTTGADTGKQGDTPSGAFYANGYALIMGTGLTNDTISSTYRNAPQIYGGSRAASITTSVNDLDAKDIVFGDGGNHDLEVNLGTMVIVHSGIYRNLIAGGYLSCNIGADNESKYLSTYLVIKGGTIIDTVAGGGAGNKQYSQIYGGPAQTGSETQANPDTGGTFVYMMGGFMSGDDWEDSEFKASGEYGRDKFSSVFSSILEGGQSQGKDIDNQSKVQGSTHVFLSGKSVTWDVQGGGRTVFTHTDSSYIEVSGNAVVRHLICGTITDGTTVNNNCVDHTLLRVVGYATVANIFGAGFDTYTKPTNMSMTGGTIQVEVLGGMVGDVYGGGLRGSVGSPTDYHALQVSVKVAGGEVMGNVYGGGSGGLDKMKHTADGSKDSSYGNGSGNSLSMGRSFVYGDVTVTVSGGTVHGSVYGGGMSVPKMASYAGITFSSEDSGVASVYGTVTVNITGSDTVIKGSVYGGGRGIELKETATGWTPDRTPTVKVANLSGIGTENAFKDMYWVKESIPYQYDVSEKYIKVVSSSDHTITGGDYLESAKVDGKKGETKTTVIVSGSPTISGSVYGGGALGKVYGDTTVVMQGGNVVGSVFGGGLGRVGHMAVSGERGVFIDGATILNSVYGGSSDGYDGPGTELPTGYKRTDAQPADYKNSTVVVTSANITGSIFGGGSMGKTYGSTFVYIGWGYSRNDDGSYIPDRDRIGFGTKSVTVDSVYAGGNIDPGNGQVANPYTSNLVQGHGLVEIYGLRVSVTITGSVMGSGNSCNTALSTVVNMVSFRNAAAMAAVHRADSFSMYSSSIRLAGRNALNPSKVCSIYDIGEMTMQYDSELVIDNPADQVRSLTSLNRDGNPTAVSSPSNKITFTSGSTFYIRPGTTELYGVVTGYFAISTDVEGGYGAYVLGSRNSPGGFVTLSNGTYRDANISDSANYTRCWYISGTENKVVTMQLTTSGTGLITDQATIALTKLMGDGAQGSKIRYNGGSFISMAADPGTEQPFYFSDPAGWDDETHLATNQLGLTFSNAYGTTWFGGDVGAEMPGPAGDQTLTLALKAKPYANASIYLGYVILDFDEIQTTSLGTEDEQKIIINSISLRIDMYIVPQQMVADNNYDVLLMTDRTPEGNITNINGYAEILVPKGFTMGALKLVSVDNTGANGNPISVTAVINHDNTTGWSSTAGTVKWSSSADNNKGIGIMSGSVIATIRYSVDHFVYPDNAVTDPKFVLRFSTTVPGGEPVTTTVTITVKEKEPCKITFVDSKSTVDPVVKEFGYGTEVSASMCPAAVGQNFIGWYADPGFNNPYDHKRPLTEDITLYARYVYVVTLDNMDGTTSKIYAPEQSGGTRLGTLPELDRGYEYEFGGWYKDRALTAKWNPNLDTVTENTTLYAKWTGVSMVIEFYLSDGTTVFPGPEGQRYEGKYILRMATEIDGDRTVKVPIYPTVSYGATFGTMDETQGKNIMEVAKGWAMDQDHYRGKYISWQIYGTTTPVYADTVLTPSLFSLGSNTAHLIRLVAVTSDIAISLEMTPGVDDASATVASPSSFLVQPLGITEVGGRYYDFLGNEYTRTQEESGRYRYDPVDPDGPALYFYDGHGGYYMQQNPAVMEQFEEIVGDEEVVRYLDIYGNVWSKVGNDYVFVRCTVYTGNEVPQVVEAEQDFPENSYYMDVFTNRYTRDQTGTPDRTDTYTCIRGSPYSYTFSYTLNDATRSGYSLLGWHNTRVDPGHAQDPRAGTVRTLMVFATPNYNDTGKTVVKKEFINILDTVDLSEMYMTVDYDKTGGGYPVLNDPTNAYKVTYVAKWSKLAYTVTVSDPANGSINAFITTTPVGGTESTVLIDGRYTSAHYGDTITLTYTPSEHYTFDRWIVTGEYDIVAATSSTTTLIVRGNCSISVSDVGDRVLRLEMVFDNNNPEETTDADLAKTSVYIRDKDTGETMDIPLTSLLSARPAIFSAYVPLGTYEVHVLYEFSADNIVDCKMVGDAKVTKDDSTDYRYILISARIKASQEIEEGGHTVTYVTRGEQYVITYTKYVGALDSMIFGKPEDLIINNKDSGLPPVELKIMAGCKYLAFEGFPDGGKFILNREVNFFQGATTEVRTLEFNLNWTKYDKPADIIVQIDPDGYRVRYSNFDGTITGYLDTVFQYDGAPFGLQALTQAMSAKLGEGQEIVDWYFDTNRAHKVVNDSRIDATTIGYVDANKVITLYADITSSAVVRTTIQVFAEGSDQPIAVTPMFPLVLNNGNYTGTFVLRHTEGCGTPKKIAPEGIHSDKVQQTITSGQAFDTMAISITSDDWKTRSGSVILKVQYPLHTATLSLNINPADVESGAWSGSKSVKYGDEVELPVMKVRTGGYAITGWESSNHVAAYLKNDGKYYYTLGGDETGTVSLTALYPVEQVTISFATPIGSIGDTRKQSTSVTVDKGTQVTVPAITDYDTNYTFNGFKIGNDTYQPQDEYTASASGTLTASWSAGDLNFTYSRDAHLGVSVSAGANTVSVGTTQIKYGTVLTINVTPENGFDLDLDSTTVSGSSIGSPTVSGGTYTFNFRLNQATTVEIKEKSMTADISFIVNGTKNTDFVAYSLDGTVQYVGGAGIPLNTTVKFYRFGTASDSFGWYSDPVMANKDLLPSVIEDSKETYYVTVKENVSVYTTSGRYVVEYTGHDGRMVQETLEKDGQGRITLKGSMIEMIYPGHILVGWGMEGGNGIEYTYKLGQSILVGESTPSKILLTAFYLTTGDITVTYTGDDFYSTPAIIEGEADPEMTLHYSVTEMSADPAADNYYAKKRDNDMYVYPIYPGAIVFRDPGVHTVYYYGTIGTEASQDVIHGTFTITIHGDCTLTFYDGDAVVEVRELVGDEEVGELPTRTRSGYTLEGWFLDDGTKLTAEMTAVELGETASAHARWTPSGGGGEEIIVNPDGSITVKTKETERNPDGTTTTTTTETTTKRNSDGTRTEAIQKKEERSDGYSRDEMAFIEKNRSGEVTVMDMTIVTVTPEGEEKVSFAAFDSGSLTVSVPDTTGGDLSDVLGAVALASPESVSVEVRGVEDADLNQEWISAMVDGGFELTLSLEAGRVGLDADVMENLGSKGGDYVLTLRETEPGDVSEDQREVIGDAYAVTVTLEGDGSRISILGGIATVTIRPGGDVRYAYFVNADGEVEEVPCAYDEGTGLAVMTLEHFSVYMLSDEPVTPPEPPVPPVPPEPSEDGLPLAWIAVGAVAAAMAAFAAVLLVRRRRTRRRRGAERPSPVRLPDVILQVALSDDNAISCMLDVNIIVE